MEFLDASSGYTTDVCSVYYAYAYTHTYYCAHKLASQHGACCSYSYPDLACFTPVAPADSNIAPTSHKTCHSCRRPIVGVSGAVPVISGLNSFAMYNTCTYMYFVLHTHTLLLHKVIVPIDAHCMIFSLSAHSLQPCITAQDLSWHQEHFVCSRCNTDLSQGGCTVHNNRDTVCVHGMSARCMCV